MGESSFGRCMRVSKNITFQQIFNDELIESLFLVCSCATATNTDTKKKKKVQLEIHNISNNFKQNRVQFDLLCFAPEEGSNEIKNAITIQW